MKFLVPKGARVLDLGCGTGELLAELEPSYGVGVDLSPAMIDQAQRLHPDLTVLMSGMSKTKRVIARLEGPFDYIVLSDTIGMLDDIETRSAPVASGSADRTPASSSPIIRSSGSRS